MSDAPTDLRPLFAAPDGNAAQVQPILWSTQTMPLGGLHGWLKGALITCLVLDGFVAAMNLSLLWIYAALEGGVVFSDLQLNGYDAITLYADQLLRPLFLIALVASIFLFCRFIYRALRNLDLSNVPGDRMPPGWAVAYNFIPIMNFWKPLLAMSQAWRGSIDPERSDTRPPQVIGWWWGLSLISGFIAVVSLRVSIDAGALGLEIIDFEGFKLSLWLDVLSSAASILSALFLLPVISGIAKAQDARIGNT